jgi:hypothetical protein
MTSHSEIIVTLSVELLGHLRGVAALLEVPFELLVAGIVCDTIERSADLVRCSTSQLDVS